jgi:hypothetical protein
MKLWLDATKVKAEPNFHSKYLQSTKPRQPESPLGSPPSFFLACCARPETKTGKSGFHTKTLDAPTRKQQEQHGRPKYCGSTKTHLFFEGE